MNQTIYDLVASISPLDALEATHQADVLEWIQSGAELCRLDKPDTPPKHLVSYVTLYDPSKKALLLVDHKKAGLWLPPGGHVDPGEHPQATAHRELQEELFVSLPLLTDDPLFVTVTETVGRTAGHTDVSLWYVFLCDSNRPLQFDRSEFKQIRWFSLSELPLAKSDPHLSRFSEKLLSNRWSHSPL